MPAAAQTPDASTNYRVEPGRTGFLGGGTLGRPPLDVRWRRTLGAAVSTPVVVGDRIFTSFFTPGETGRTSVVALDAATGATVWTRSFPGRTKVAHGPGTVVVLTEQAIVTAVRASDGVTRWARQLPEPFTFHSSAVVRGDLVYVGLAWSGGVMHVLRLADGVPVFGTDFYDAGPAAVRGGLAFQSTGCSTVAVDAQTGAPAWRAEQGCTSYDGDVATAGGHVIARQLTFGPDAFVLDGATGARLGVVPMQSAPALAGDTMVYLVEGVMRARSLSTGLELWAAPGPFATAPTVVDHAVYTETARGAIVAVDLRTGEEIWRDQARPDGEYGYWEYPDWTNGIAAGAGVLAVPAGADLVVYESALPAAGAGLRIVSGPEGAQRERSATFEIASSLPTECRLDGARWVACAGVVSHPLLSEGSHVFEVRNLLAGEPQALDQRGFSIDVTPPLTEIISGPEPLSRITSAQLKWRVEGVHTGSECKLDGADWKPCASPVEHSGLAEGEHTFLVRSFDHLGNVEDPPERHEWTIDSKGPVLTLTSAPPRLGNSSDVSISWSQSEPGPARCSLRHGEFKPCSSPVTYEDLADGHHWVHIIATDAAGNDGGVVHSFEIDTKPPETYLNQTDPPAATRQPRPAFHFSSQFTVQPFECRMDDGPWVDCESGWHPSEDLPDGPHTFAVRALDDAGNVDPTPATRAFTVDTRSPGVVIDAAPPERTTSRDASVRFHTDESAQATCSWDGGEAGACGSPTTRTNLSDGEHSVKIVARDPAGNLGHETVRWTIDSEAPGTAIDEGPTGATPENRPVFAFSSPDAGAAFECRMDEGGWIACSSPWKSGELGDGAHQFQVRAVDDLGNTDATPATRAFVVDTQAPSLQITGSPPARTTSRTATVTFTTDDAALTSCSWDDGEFTPCSSPARREDLGDGTHHVEVRARDGAGNTTIRSASWEVDRRAPETVIDRGPTGTTRERRPTFEFSSPEPATFQCALDGSAWFACESPWTSKELPAGAHRFSVRAVDDLGNADATPAERTFTVEVDAPPSTKAPSEEQPPPPGTAPPATQPPAPPDPSPDPSRPSPPARHWVIDPGPLGWPGSARAVAIVLDDWLATQKGATLARRRRFAVPYLETRTGLLTITLRSGRRVVARGSTTVSAGMAWGRLEFLRGARARVRRARSLEVDVTFQPAAGGAPDRALRRASLQR